MQMSSQHRFGRIFYGLIARSRRSDFVFFFQAEDGIRDVAVTGVQTCALPISAHPAKFADVVMKAIGTAPPLPDRLAAYLKCEKLSLPISSSYDEFKQFLLSDRKSVV